MATRPAPKSHPATHRATWNLVHGSASRAEKSGAPPVRRSDRTRTAASAGQVASRGATIVTQRAPRAGAAVSRAGTGGTCGPKVAVDHTRRDGLHSYRPVRTRSSEDDSQHLCRLDRVPRRLTAAGRGWNGRRRRGVAPPSFVRRPRRRHRSLLLSVDARGGRTRAQPALVATPVPHAPKLRVRIPRRDVHLRGDSGWYGEQRPGPTPAGSANVSPGGQARPRLCRRRVVQSVRVAPAV